MTTVCGLQREQERGWLQRIKARSTSPSNMPYSPPAYLLCFISIFGAFLIFSFIPPSGCICVVVLDYSFSKLCRQGSGSSISYRSGLFPRFKGSIVKHPWRWFEPRIVSRQYPTVIVALNFFRKGGISILIGVKIGYDETKIEVAICGLVWD